MSTTDRIIEALEPYGFEPFDWRDHHPSSKPGNGTCSGVECERDPIVQRRFGSMQKALCLRCVLRIPGRFGSNTTPADVRQAVPRAVADAIRHPEQIPATHA